MERIALLTMAEIHVELVDWSRLYYICNFDSRTVTLDFEFEMCLRRQTKRVFLRATIQAK